MHDLEILENGEASHAFVGETPWHGLGKRVPADLSSDQMLEAAGLNWEVQKYDMFAADEEGYPVLDVDPRKALIRTSDFKFFDVVSNDWNILQNSEAFEFFSEFVNVGNMSMHTAGSLDGGRLVWALAKVNRSFEVVKDDVIEQFLLFTNPHKYGRSIDVRFTPIRVVCNNTLSMALRQYSQDVVRVNHRQKFDSNAVKETMGIADQRFDEYEEATRFLLTKRYTMDSLKEYMNSLFPTSSRKKEISRPGQTALDHVEVQPGASYGQGTWYNAFNAVTFSVDHLMGNSQETRLRSAWYGTNAKKKNEALQKAIKMAEAA